MVFSIAAATTALEWALTLALALALVPSLPRAWMAPLVLVLMLLLLNAGDSLVPGYVVGECSRKGELSDDICKDRAAHSYYHLEGIEIDHSRAATVSPWAAPEAL